VAQRSIIARHDVLEKPAAASRDFRVQPQRRQELHSSGMLRSE